MLEGIVIVLERATRGENIFNVLRMHIERTMTLENDEIEFMRGLFVPETLRAGERLQLAGEVAKYAIFVAKGSLKLYAIDSPDHESVAQYAAEMSWLADTHSLMFRTPSPYVIEAIEDSDVLLIDPLSYQVVLQCVPGFAAALESSVPWHAVADFAQTIEPLHT